MVMSYKPWTGGCTEKETNCNQTYEFKYTIQIAVNLQHCQKIHSTKKMLWLYSMYDKYHEHTLLELQNDLNNNSFKHLQWKHKDYIFFSVILIYMDTKCNHIISCSLKFKTMEMLIRLRQYFTTLKFYFLSDTVTESSREKRLPSLYYSHVALM